MANIKAKKTKDTYSYKGWLVSDRFLKRAFAIVGYSSVATLIIYGVLLVLFVVFALLFGGIAALAKMMYT